MAADRHAPGALGVVTTRRAMLRRISLALAAPALLGCAGLPAGLGSPGAKATTSSLSPSAGSSTSITKQLVVALAGDVANLDPYIGVQGPDVDVLGNVFDSLVGRHADLKLHPRLATEWKRVADTVWEFNLRHDAKFHNGDPVTARDVKFSLERIVDPQAKTLVASTFTSIDHVDVVDDFTAKVVTKKPDPLMPARQATYGAQIIPMDYFQKVGADQFSRKPVGSGPFKLVEWVKDDHVLLARNEAHWDQKPPCESLIFKPMPETASRLAAFARGEAHIIVQVGSDHVAEVNNSGRGRVVAVPFQGVYQLAINYRVAPLNNKLVNQALSLAIDRPGLIKSLYAGQAQVLSGPIEEGSFAFDRTLPPLPFDPAAARDRLRQAGYAREEIVLESATEVANEKQLDEAIVGMWRDVGVNARQEVIEMSVRSQHYREKSFKGLWITDSLDLLLDPDGLMWRGLAPGGLFDFGWRNAEFDRLGDEARYSLDDAVRQRDYARMAQLVLEHVPWIQLFRPNVLYGVNSAIDWNPYGTAIMDLRGYNLSLR